MELGLRADLFELTLAFAQKEDYTSYTAMIFLSSAAVLLSLESVLPFSWVLLTCFCKVWWRDSYSGVKASTFNNSRQIKPLLFLAFLDQSIKPDGLWRGIVCAVGKSNIIHFIFNWFPKGTWWCEKDKH